MTGRSRMATAMFGGATALVLALGVGGAGVSPGASMTTPRPSFSAATTQPSAATAPGTVVHAATLAACVSGLDC